ncbi:MAG: hypothetical protein RIG26_04140 [Thalassospira sp.]|uniref:hypothetical protein n=1 Tax=Thalassospira sp. TaxID=1912094 RepID=UPI0032F00CCA
MGWFSIKMTEQEALGISNSFIESFEKLFQAANAPENAALFCSLQLGTDDAYFLSPEAKKLAEPALVMRPATACPRPSKKDVILLVGNESALKLLG